MDPTVRKLLKSFFEAFEKKSFEKGESIINPKKEKAFFLTKGVVRMFNDAIGKKELTLNIYRPYSVFPMSLIFSGNNKYSYAALTDVKGYLAPKEKFEDFVKKNPQVLFDLVKRIYKGLDGFYQQLETLLLGDAFSKVVLQLIIHSRRFGKIDQDKVAFNWNLTHHQLASQTGLARESVTREIIKLQKKGLIGYSGKKLFISNLIKLEEEYFSYLNVVNKMPLDKKQKL